MQWCWGVVTPLRSCRTHFGLFSIGHVCLEKGGGGLERWASRLSMSCGQVVVDPCIVHISCPSSPCTSLRFISVPCTTCTQHPCTPAPPPCTPRTLTAPRYLKFISLGGFKHVLSVLQNWGSTFVVEAPEATPPLRMSRSLSNASEASADLTEGE